MCSQAAYRLTPDTQPGDGSVCHTHLSWSDRGQSMRPEQPRPWRIRAGETPRALLPSGFAILLRDRPVLLLSHLGARIGALIEEALAPVNLDSREFAVLGFLISAASPAGVGAIAARIGRDRTTVAETV